MGRITINGTQAGFSCKREVSLPLWDVKANRAKGKSEEARTLNQELDNIKAQITKHYQYICDHDSFVTAKKVYNRYVGFGDDYHTLMGLFREQLESYKEKVGKGKAESTYRGLVADYKSLLLFMKSVKNIEDIVIDELENHYRRLLHMDDRHERECQFHSLQPCKHLEMADVYRTGKGWLRVHPLSHSSACPNTKDGHSLPKKNYKGSFMWN